MRNIIRQIFSDPVVEIRAVSGGDISVAHLVKTQNDEYFVKLNSGQAALSMFEAEAAGLARLGHINGVSTPEVYKSGIVNGKAFIAMEFIPQEAATPQYWKNLAEALVKIHQTTGTKFGLDDDNFIGSLRQSNAYSDDWITFYDQYRLRPQVQLAFDNNLLERTHLRYLDDLVNRLPQICPMEAPALVHGDLWAGNKICGPRQTAYFIDPAVSFAHREMDLAMAKLFGGFDQVFFNHYQALYPLKPGFPSRCNIYQLYYLLVHLNLFGRSYYHQVNDIMKEYS